MPLKLLGVLDAVKSFDSIPIFILGFKERNFMQTLRVKGNGIDFVFSLGERFLKETVKHYVSLGYTVTIV